MHVLDWARRHACYAFSPLPDHLCRKPKRHRDRPKPKPERHVIEKPVVTTADGPRFKTCSVCRERMHLNQFGSQGKSDTCMQCAYRVTDANRGWARASLW